METDNKNDAPSTDGMHGFEETAPFDMDEGDSIDPWAIGEPIAAGESRINMRRKLRTREKPIIEQILMTETINLIGGPSGIGKSTLLFQLLYEWSHGQRIFGKFKSFPCPFVYISNDRSTLETDRTLRRLGYGDWDIPIFGIEDIAATPSIEAVFSRFRNVGLFVIEGLQAMIPEGSGDQNKREMAWAMGIRRTLAQRGAALLATTHVPKSKPDSGHSRNNFLMSASLHACMSTMISFDIPAAFRPGGPRHGQRTGDREVLIHLRDHPDLLLNFTREQNGRFKLIDEDYVKEVNLDTWFDALPIGAIVSTKELQKRIEASGMSLATGYRWRRELEEDGRFTPAEPPAKRGTWIKNF